MDIVLVDSAGLLLFFNFLHGPDKIDAIAWRPPKWCSPCILPFFTGQLADAPKSTLKENSYSVPAFPHPNLTLIMQVRSLSLRPGGDKTWIWQTESSIHYRCMLSIISFCSASVLHYCSSKCAFQRVFLFQSFLIISFILITHSFIHSFIVAVTRSTSTSPVI
jgi:hypothetical protein